MGWPKGRTHSSETKAKLSAAGMGNQHLLGVKPTAEARAKMSVARMGNQNGLKHGHKTHGKQSGTYTTWADMLQRCTNPKNAGYKYWGGRGIDVCVRWRGVDGFDAFLADMGERPDGLSIDRIDNDGNYEPANCRWATPQEQRLNQRPRRKAGIAA